MINEVPYRIGDATVDFFSGRAELHGGSVALSPKESQLLRYLLTHSGEVISRKELLARVWGSVDVETRTVDVHVAKLRRKLEVDPQHPRYLITVRKNGYSLLLNQAENR